MKTTTTTTNGLSFGGWAAIIFGVLLILFGLNEQAYIVALLGFGIIAIFVGGAWGVGGVGVLVGFVVLFALLTFPADSDRAAPGTPADQGDGRSLDELQRDYYDADPSWG